MKVTLTGSIGHIGKPLIQELVQKGHSVTVISSNPEKLKEIEAMGAIPVIGSLEDLAFVTTAFTGADVVYTMVPPANYFNPNLDLLGYFQKIGTNYSQAIEQTGVKKVINLSTIGGHLSKGNGILLGANHVENLLNDLPSEVSIVHIRPTEIYYNLLPQVYSAKNNGFITSNVGNEVVNSWVSPLDIAAAVAEEIITSFTGRKIRYVASEDVTYNELITILGEAVGNPDLKWLTVTNEQMQSGLEAIGMQKTAAKGMTEMYAAIDSGLLYEDYNLHKPKIMGKVKVKDFAKDFAAAYNQL
jgi:uncharacterized protein YbjT (DUF2867 family)